MECLPGIRGRLEEAAGLELFLDYDGTLTPIVERPELARLAPSTRRLLAELAAKGVTAAIVSGRSRADLESRVSISVHSPVCQQASTSASAPSGKRS
jgi:trehalose-phosphatase